MKNKLMLLLLIVPTLHSCMRAPKVTRNKTKASIYEEYLINDSTKMYFIKPIIFKSNKNTAIIDFSFNVINNVPQKVTMNYTINSKEFTSEIKPFKLIGNNLKEFKPQAEHIMFRKKDKSNYHIRFTSTVGFDEMVFFLNSREKPKVQIGIETLLPKNNSKRKIKLLGSELFEFVLKP